MGVRKIEIAINCNEKTCGKCRFDDDGYCHLFDAGESVNGKSMRDSLCLAAEQRASFPALAEAEAK